MHISGLWISGLIKEQVEIITKGAKGVRLKAPPRRQAMTCTTTIFSPRDEDKRKYKHVLPASVRFIFGHLYELICILGPWVLLRIPSSWYKSNSEMKLGSLSLSGLYDLFINTGLCFEVSQSMRCVHVPEESVLNTTRSPRQLGIPTTGKAVKSVTS